MLCSTLGASLDTTIRRFHATFYNLLWCILFNSWSSMCSEQFPFLNKTIHSLFVANDVCWCAHWHFTYFTKHTHVPAHIGTAYSYVCTAQFLLHTHFCTTIDALYFFLSTGYWRCVPYIIDGLETVPAWRLCPSTRFERFIRQTRAMSTARRGCWTCQLHSRLSAQKWLASETIQGVTTATDAAAADLKSRHVMSRHRYIPQATRLV